MSCGQTSIPKLKTVKDLGEGERTGKELADVMERILKLNDTLRLQIKGWKNTYPANNTKRKPGLPYQWQPKKTQENGIFGDRVIL